MVLQIYENMRYIPIRMYTSNVFPYSQVLCATGETKFEFTYQVLDRAEGEAYKCTDYIIMQNRYEKKLTIHYFILRD